MNRKTKEALLEQIFIYNEGIIERLDQHCKAIDQYIKKGIEIPNHIKSSLKDDITEYVKDASKLESDDDEKANEVLYFSLFNAVMKTLFSHIEKVHIKTRMHKYIRNILRFLVLSLYSVFLFFHPIVHFDIITKIVILIAIFIALRWSDKEAGKVDLKEYARSLYTYYNFMDYIIDIEIIRKYIDNEILDLYKENQKYFYEQMNELNGL